MKMFWLPWNMITDERAIFGNLIVDTFVKGLLGEILRFLGEKQLWGPALRMATVSGRKPEFWHFS